MREPTDHKSDQSTGFADGAATTISIELDEDGLPPIIPLSEFNKASLRTDAAEHSGPLCECSECGGELAEPIELTEHRKEFPSYQPCEPCDCEHDDAGLFSYVKEVTDRWSERNKKVADILDKYGALLHYTPEKELEKLASKVGIAKDKFFNQGDDHKIVSLDKFMAEVQSKPERPVLIEGLLKKESKAMMSSTSKLGKTWIALDLGLTVSNGGSWAGFKCNKGKVLYLSFELKADTLCKRFQMLFKELCEDNYPNFDIMELRGYQADPVKIAELIIKRSEGKGYDLIIVDPLYKMLGDWDENSARDMNQLMNLMELIAQETKAAIMIVAHFTKGSSANKNSGDRTSGSGVLTRDMDAVIEIVPGKGQEDNPNPLVDVHFKNREFLPIAPFVAKMDGRILTRTEGVKVSTGAAASAKRPAWDLGEVLVLLLDGEQRRVEWHNTAKETGMSKRQFDDAVRTAIEQGFASKGEGKFDPYSLTAEGKKKALEHRVFQGFKGNTPTVSKEVVCVHERGFDTQTLTCPVSGRTIEGNNETEAEPGDTLTYLFMTLKDECTCGNEHVLE